jgi:diaminopimelate epimerase
MKYFKYHALGNDYLVLPPSEAGGELFSGTVRRICDRNRGPGSDGILFGPLPSLSCDFRLRIFNPDASEAEKSGNGLRIFARFLYDQGLVAKSLFTIETLGGPVTCRVAPGGRSVTVEMGRVTFPGPERESLQAGDRVFEICAASVGNPHCVVLGDDPSPELARRYGPMLETHPRFPERTNVQFMQALDRQNIRIEIWERGAGYTLASGSSSTAAAAVARRLGWCDAGITVHMPGGRLFISLSDDFSATMTGPVTRVCDGVLFPEIFEDVQ